jgi:hypothetical protein
MTLVEVESASEQARILNITIRIQAPFLIGLNRSCGINSYSVWLSGKPMTFSNLGMYVYNHDFLKPIYLKIIKLPLLLVLISVFFLHDFSKRKKPIDESH